MDGKECEIREGYKLIEVKGLNKKYGEHKALSGLSFAVKPGENVALVGLGGAGKTTLMDILAGALEADSGKVEICGIDMVENPYDAKANVGYMPAVPPLYEDMTPRRYLKFVTDARGVSAREATEKIDQAIRLARLTDVSDTPARNLSESARRMLSLAQAALLDPRVLLIDEPSAGLDVRDAIELRRAIAQKKKEGAAILIATRNLTEVKDLCDRVLVLEEGRLTGEAPADRLMELELETGELAVRVQGGEDAVRRALSAFKVESLEEAGEAGAVDVVITPAGDQRAAVSSALAAAGLPLLELRRRTVPGEKLLTRLVTEQVVAEEEGEAGHESDL